MTRQVAVTSLGCAKNQVDTEVMLGLLRAKGFTVTADPYTADVLLINTCGFIKAAKEEAIQAILEWVELKKARQENPPLLVVTGCLVQRYARELAAEIPEIDLLAGTGAVEKIPDLILQVLEEKRKLPPCVGMAGSISEEVFPRFRWQQGASAYLKIAEGCDNRCHYCAIPFIRGKFRSRSIPSVVAEAKRLVAEGVKELVLVAQDTTRFGVDLYGRPVLPELLRELEKIDELTWIRVLYTQPRLITPELIETIATSRKICHYLDIPFQHSSRRVLERMGRWGDGETYLKLLAEIRKAMPDVVLRTTVMVGFPGEAEEDFQDLLTFLRTARFDRVGGFVFSPEEGTPAFHLKPRVPLKIAERRLTLLLGEQRRISLGRLLKRLGKVEKVLVEGRLSSEKYYGRSWREAPEVDGRVVFRGPVELKPGSVVPVYLQAATAHDLAGEVLGRT